MFNRKISLFSQISISLPSDEFNEFNLEKQPSGAVYAYSLENRKFSVSVPHATIKLFFERIHSLVILY